MRLHLGHILPREFAGSVATWMRDKDFRVARLDALCPADIRNRPEAKAMVLRLADGLHDTISHILDANSPAVEADT